MPLKRFSIGLIKIKSTKNLCWKAICAMAYSKSSQYEDISTKVERVGTEGQKNHHWSIMLIPLGMNNFNSQNQTHVIVLN